MVKINDLCLLYIVMDRPSILKISDEMHGLSMIWQMLDSIKNHGSNWKIPSKISSIKN